MHSLNNNFLESLNNASTLKKPIIFQIALILGEYIFPHWLLKLKNIYT